MMSQARAVKWRAEIAAVGGHPLEAPAKAFLDGFDLLPWGARNSHVRYIVMIKMHERTIDMVDLE